MPRFNPISKYSRDRPRSLHLNIIRDDHVDVSIKAKRLQLVSFTLLCNNINVTVSFLQNSILTTLVCLFTSSLKKTWQHPENNAKKQLSNENQNDTKFQNVRCFH